MVLEYFSKELLIKSFFEQHCAKLQAECARLQAMNHELTAFIQAASPTASPRFTYTPQEGAAKRPFIVGDLVSIKKSTGHISGLNLVVAVLPEGKYRVRYYNGRLTTKARHELVSGMSIGDDVAVSASLGLESTGSAYSQAVKISSRPGSANCFTGLKKGTRGKVVSYNRDVRQLFSKPEGVNLSSQWLDAQGSQMGYAIIRVEDGYYTNQYAVPMHQLKPVANIRIAETQSRTNSPRVEPPTGSIRSSRTPVVESNFVHGTFHAEEIEELVSGDDDSSDVTDETQVTDLDTSSDESDETDETLVSELNELVRAIKDTFGGQDAPYWCEIDPSCDQDMYCTERRRT